MLSSIEEFFPDNGAYLPRCFVIDGLCLPFFQDFFKKFSGEAARALSPASRTPATPGAWRDRTSLRRAGSSSSQRRLLVARGDNCAFRSWRLCLRVCQILNP